MSPATILRIHSIISSALDLAVRYEWAERNVAKNARPPHPRKREPDRTPWNPDTMTHRYRRYARRVGITSSLKELRHYSATQLLAAGTGRRAGLSWLLVAPRRSGMRRPACGRSP